MSVYKTAHAQQIIRADKRTQTQIHRQHRKSTKSMERHATALPFVRFERSSQTFSKRSAATNSHFFCRFFAPILFLPRPLLACLQSAHGPQTLGHSHTQERFAAAQNFRLAVYTMCASRVTTARSRSWRHRWLWSGGTMAPIVARTKCLNRIENRNKNKQKSNERWSEKIKMNERAVLTTQFGLLCWCGSDFKMSNNKNCL